MPPDPLELLTIEREIRELASSAETFAEARAECARAIDRAVAEADEVAAHVDDLEEIARRRRHERGDVVLRRVDLERELNDALEIESLASARRAQLEQRAAGLRAAQAFAASNRADAELGLDTARAERESVTARRAEHEARICEAQAREALGDEHRAAEIRKDLEERVDAVRHEEATLNRRRDEAEAEADAARERLARAQADVEHVRSEAARLDNEIARYGEKRTRTEKRLRGVRNEAKVRLEARLAELKATETSLQRQRTEIERLIAVVENEGPIDEPLDFALLDQLPPLDETGETEPSGARVPELRVPEARIPEPQPARKPVARAAAPAKPKTTGSAPKPDGDGGSIGLGLARMLVGTLFPRSGSTEAPK